MLDRGFIKDLFNLTDRSRGTIKKVAKMLDEADERAQSALKQAAAEHLEATSCRFVDGVPTMEKLRAANEHAQVSRRNWNDFFDAIEDRQFCLDLGLLHELPDPGCDAQAMVGGLGVEPNARHGASEDSSARVLEPVPARPHRKPESDGSMMETLRR